MHGQNHENEILSRLWNLSKSLDKHHMMYLDKDIHSLERDVDFVETNELGGTL